MIPVKKLRMEFEKNKGVRVGQTAVVSRKVHTINSNHPERVNIVVNADAGKVFYGRLTENEIIHIDLFHKITVFDLMQMTDFLKKGLIENSMGNLLDYIDIQTGSGGGKLTGSLNYGLTETLKNSHLNHVHIAALIPDCKLETVFLLVAKVEEALQAQNVELRKVENINHEIGNKPTDMSSYSSDFDSNLKQDGNISSDGRIYRETLEMIEHFGSLRGIEEVVEMSLESNKKNSEFENIVKVFEQKGFMYKQQNKYHLTKDGEKLKNFIKLNRKELESILKKAIKNSPKLNSYKGLETTHFSETMGKSQKGPRIYKLFNPEEWIEELDVTETVKNSVVRSFLENKKFGIEQQDIVSVKRMPRVQQDICLIIDASASMAGFRLGNAKYLAKYLILKRHIRISVMAFQEKEVNTYVPFTRNYDILEEGLNKILSTGLTPLALALDKGLSFMSTGNLKNPLIMLITDGIPTVSLWTSDPVKDAIRAAEKIAKKKINFCCIGLQPNKNCLVKITEAAKGKLYVLDELKREVLVEVARKSGQLI